MVICKIDKLCNSELPVKAIREDRTRGGRSTYQCSYTLPASLVSPPGITQESGKGIDTVMPGMVKQEAGEPISLHSHNRLVPPLLQVSNFVSALNCNYLQALDM